MFDDILKCFKFLLNSNLGDTFAEKCLEMDFLTLDFWSKNSCPKKQVRLGWVGLTRLGEAN